MFGKNAEDALLFAFYMIALTSIPIFLHLIGTSYFIIFLPILRSASFLLKKKHSRNFACDSLCVVRFAFLSIINIERVTQIVTEKQILHVTNSCVTSEKWQQNWRQRWIIKSNYESLMAGNFYSSAHIWNKKKRNVMRSNNNRNRLRM